MLGLRARHCDDGQHPRSATDPGGAARGGAQRAESDRRGDSEPGRANRWARLKSSRAAPRSHDIVDRGVEGVQHRQRGRPSPPARVRGFRIIAAPSNSIRSLPWRTPNWDSRTAALASRCWRPSTPRKPGGCATGSSDREKFYIDFTYDRQVTGNLEKAYQTLELWFQTLSPHGPAKSPSSVRGHFHSWDRPIRQGDRRLSQGDRARPGFRDGVRQSRGELFPHRSLRGSREQVIQRGVRAQTGISTVLSHCDTTSGY